MTKLLRSIPIIILSFIPTLSLAGSTGGPYIIWVNLPGNAAINKIIDKNLGDGETCGTHDMQLFPPPTWLTKELIQKALIVGEKKSISMLSKLLQQPDDGSPSGFDGILIYDEINNPRFSSITRGSKSIIREGVTDPKNNGSFWEAFCIVSPTAARPI